MDNLREILGRFVAKKVLVIGDVMLDRYIYGNVSRINPEAPVPIVGFNKENCALGGAGNVASNLCSLGGNVCIIGFLGRDKEADIVKKLLLEKKIDYFFDECEITTQKIRVIGERQQIARIDKENTKPKTFSEEVKNIILEKAEEADIIAIPDYSKGAVTDDLMNLLFKFKKKLIIHPKPKNTALSSYLLRDSLLLISSEDEILEASNFSNIFGAGENFRRKFNSDILVTRGEKGMTLFAENRVEIPTYTKKIYDVQGARDTVMAAVSLAIASGASLEEAGIIANRAAGIAVENTGTYSVSFNELKSRVLTEERKLVNLKELRNIVLNLKKQGKKIVWTNGCFDVLHAGHKYSLEKAKQKGDVLIVGVDSDESVRKLKGSERPIYKEKERIELLSAMESVDYVTVFSYGEAINYLKELRPDVYVKSGNYTIESINQEERKIIEECGGEIYLPKGIEGFSTTSVIERIKGNQNVFDKNRL